MQSSSIVMSQPDADLPGLFRLAGALLQAQGIIPSHLRKEGEVVAVILTGRELGIPPMAALRSVSIVQGRVVIDAGAQLGLMIRAGAKVRWDKDGSDGEAVLVIERPGMPPFTSAFSLEQAKTAGLTGKQTWKSYPAAMLRARCVSAAGKAYFADVLAGVYVPGELGEDDASGYVDVKEIVDAGSAKMVEPARPPAQGEAKAAPAKERPETEPERLVRELYAGPTRPVFGLLRDQARAAKPTMNRDEQLAVKAALEHAEKRLAEAEAGLEQDRKEAEAAEAALAAKVDEALEPGASDAPDPVDLERAASSTPAAQEASAP